MVLNATSKLYSLLWFERNGGKCFAVELDPERDRDPRCQNRESPYISTWVEEDKKKGGDRGPHRGGWDKGDRRHSGVSHGRRREQVGLSPGSHPKRVDCFTAPGQRRTCR